MRHRTSVFSSPELPARSRIPRVALLVESTRSYARDLLTGIRRYIAAHGPWSTFLELRAQDSTPPAWLRHWDGDGLLTRSFTPEISEMVAATGLPAVELRSTHVRGIRPFVGTDNSEVGRMVADHFFERGYRRFAVYGLENEQFFVDRVQNFVAAVEGYGCSCAVFSETHMDSVPDWEKCLARLKDWLCALQKPTAVFAVNDALGARLLEACLRAGVSVPEEIAVLGAENDESLCTFASPALSSVQFDAVEVGFAAAGLLDRLMRGEKPPEGEILFPPRGIVVRRSSDAFVLEDSLVASAARLIRDHAPLGLNVEELCRRLNVSRSTLERRMRASLNRSPKEEIRRVRFREVERLLTETDLTVEAVAAQTGFLHTHYLQSAFKETYGVTPGVFRKTHSTKRRAEQGRV
jgi:LacI family transcriptional regulator